MIKSILNIPVSLVQGLASVISKAFQAFIAKFKKPFLPNFLSLGAIVFSMVLSFAVIAASVILEPFGIANYSFSNKLLLQIGQGGATLLGLAFALFLLPTIFQKYFNKHHWTVAKSLFTDAIAIFFGGLFMMIYSNQTGIAFFELPQALLISTAAGTLLMAISYFFRETIVSNSFKSKAKKITNKLHSEGVIENKGGFPVTKFVGANDVISLLPNQLIKVKVGKFESEFIYQNMFGTAVKTLEITAKQVRTEMEQFEQFISLNKNTYVNKNAIIKAEGDGGGIKLKVNKTEELIRVRKKFLKSL